MSESKTVGASEQGSVSPSRRRFSDEFKRNAVRLIVEEDYSFKAAAKAVGVCEKTLRQWHEQFVPPPSPCGENASQEAMRAEIVRLRRQLRRVELERDILCSRHDDIKQWLSSCKTRIHFAPSEE